MSLENHQKQFWNKFSRISHVRIGNSYFPNLALVRLHLEYSSVWSIIPWQWLEKF